MARKSSTQPITTIDLDKGELAAASTALTTLGAIQIKAEENAQALAVNFNYTGELTVLALEDEIGFYQKRSAMACLELGKRLILLKELTQHGEFITRVNALGIHERMARRFMAAAVKFTKTDSASVLKAAGSQTKMLELVTLDDDELEILNDGGTVRGLTLDAVQTMGVTQLRQAVRDKDQTIAAKDKLIADKNEKIDAFSSYKPDPDAAAKSLQEVAALNELNASVNGVDAHFTRLGVVVANLLETGASEAIRDRAVQSVQYLVARLREVVLENRIEVDVESSALGGRPEWLNQIN